jgi:sugar (pentulose or hexulose) kinase
LKQEYVIGIDAGTQSSKVSVFDLDGNRICSATQKLRPLHMPKPGVAEHPGDDLWESIAGACRAAMDSFPFAPDTILGVGLCTIRCCQLALNKEAELVAPALNWMDARVGEIYSWPNADVQYLTTSSGYITHRLTGEKKDTAANYEGQWPLDKLRWQWSNKTEILQHYNLAHENLFELALPGDILGKITLAAAEKTGLPVGLPVVATANDKAVEALGAGLKSGPTALISLGTYIGAMVYGPSHIEQAEHYFSNLACIPKRYLYECAGVRHGMGTVSWLRDLLGTSLVQEAQQLGLSPEQLLNQEALAVAAGSDGLVAIPEWLAPYDQAYKRGAMLGFHARHTRAHMYKSILEAIALTMKNNLDRMSQEVGEKVDRVIISGGGSNSDVFMQIFADVLGLPTIRNKINDTASLGSAMCAAVATNQQMSFDDAIGRMVKTAETFAPKPENTQFYQILNAQVFKNITQHTDPVFKGIHSIQK